MHLTPEQQAADENIPPEQLRELVNKCIEILKLVAQNPNTDVELLRNLANSNYASIREAVTRNPNTPTDLLVYRLGDEFPGQFLENPVFNLLMLENPNFLDELYGFTAHSLIDFPGTPEELRKRLIELWPPDRPF
jgi:hypothetical protein